ncbi:hypothetical protein MPSEU_000036400 [Mayamaea pseudoterrestris]|nr:hypothetical protein MPSEU_000036400 [Mayamaea pseudoterrestris]
MRCLRSHTGTTSNMRFALTTLAALAVIPSNAFTPTAIFKHRQRQVIQPLFAIAIDEAASSSSASSSSLEPSTCNDANQQSIPTNAKSWTDDGFVFGLEGSGLERPKGRVASLVVEDDSLETKPYQVAMVQATFACHAFFASSAFAHMLQLHDSNVTLTVLYTLLLTVASWLFADFGSGVFHWSVDNYGNGKTPVMGSMIAAFQGHHSAPWTICERGFCNNVYKLCIPFGPVSMGALYLLLNDRFPAAVWFLTVFCVLEIMSQELHKWSHQRKSEVPSWVNWLQEAGVTVGRVPHAQHHLAPYEGNYCIVSGACNDVLDESGFFRRMEHAIYKWNGVESNAWKLDADLKERTLRGDYSLRK